VLRVMENFRIESLEINKIGAFEHLKMDFPKKKDPDKAEIHILTGENGTGKTTILMLLSNIADNFNQIEFRRRIWNRPNLSKFTIVYKKNDNITSYFTEQAFGVYESPEPIKIDDSIDGISYAFFAYSNHRNIDFYDYSIKENMIFHPFIDAVNFNKSLESGNFLNWILHTKTRALIAKSNGNDLEYNSYIDSLRKIEIALSEITEKPIEFILVSKPTLYVILKIDGVELGFDVLSDGIKSTITWLGDLLMRLENITWIDQTKISLHQNFILFLDEIEVHLHPAWQRKILPVVQKLFKNAQIFISTHSPFVVGSVDGAWVHKLKKDGAYAVLDGEPILSEDGKSVRRILDEVFDIDKLYGVEVEKDLETFRTYRQKIMTGQEYDVEAFNELVKHLASQSTELEQMMGLEMNQLKRITQKELV
jgi:predicted ATP-binding protein involved in virulence